MSVCHGGLRKKKNSGGAKRAYRKKRRYELGCFQAETTLGELNLKVERARGGIRKLKLLSSKHVCVTDPKTHKTEMAEITRVARNPANVDYDRRGVMTRGAIVETSLGLARITSRPGQDGTLNAVLVKEQKS
jgi:small subunit ribosomal protein S8e